MSDLITVITLVAKLSLAEVAAVKPLIDARLGTTPTTVASAEAPKKERKPRKPKDPNAPKKAPNAYLVWKKDNYQTVKAEVSAANPTLTGNDLKKATETKMSVMWLSVKATQTQKPDAPTKDMDDVKSNLGADIDEL
jgi:hypothetical protein